MKGRHAPGLRRTDTGADTRAPGAGRERGRGARRVGRAALWLAGAVAVLFALWTLLGFVQFGRDIENPQDGFSGWQCDDPHGDCG